MRRQTVCCPAGASRDSAVEIGQEGKLRIIVVGAGIAGLSTAWSLVKRGHEVTIVEQGPIPNPLAASGDHHRIIRRAYGAAAGYGPRIY